MTRKASGILLVVAAAAAGILLTGFLIVRSRSASADRARTHATLVTVCRAVHRLDGALEGLVAASSTRAALLRSIYYRQNPGEIPVAQRNAARSIRVLAKADCSPAELGNVLSKGTP